MHFDAAHPWRQRSICAALKQGSFHSSSRTDLYHQMTSRVIGTHVAREMPRLIWHSDSALDFSSLLGCPPTLPPYAALQDQTALPAKDWMYPESLSRAMGMLRIPDV